jgi:hypothetical protein
VELVVALALLALLGGVALRAMLALGRHAAAVSEHTALQAGVRTGMLLVQAELRELGGDPGGPADLVRIAADSVTYRAARGNGLTCAVAPTEVRILNSVQFPFSGLRAIAPGRDSLLLFVDGSPGSALDDRWIRLPVLSVGTAACGALAAIAVGTVDFTPLLPAGALASVILGGPVRSFEVMRLAEYSSAGQRWLGTASVSGGDLIQPIAGPLSGAGLSLEYLDGNGAAVSDPAAVRSIRATLEGVTERAVSRNWSAGPPGFVAETLATRLSLRNVPR